MIVFTLPLFYVSLEDIGAVGSETYTWGIKDFHKCWLAPGPSTSHTAPPTRAPWPSPDTPGPPWQQVSLLEALHTGHPASPSWPCSWKYLPALRLAVTPPDSVLLPPDVFPHTLDDLLG